MTISKPGITVLDHLLYALGKRRGVVIPQDAHTRYGPYVYAVPVKENFWRALLRPKGGAIPEGMVDLMRLHEMGESTKRTHHG